MPLPQTMLLVLMLLSTQVIAADCAALRAMSEEPKKLIEQKNNIQRSEWLLLEYLSSDKSSKKTFEKEVAQSRQRAQPLVDNMNALAPLAESQPPPQEGSPECAKFEQFKADVEMMVSDREKEVAAYYKKYGFLYSCERIAQALLAHNKLMTSPDSTAQMKRMSYSVLDIGTGPFQMSARVSGAHMAEMAEQAEEALDLEPQQQYAYFALSCLKRYQKQDKSMKPPSEIQPQLKACPTTNWTQLGMCVSAAALVK
jgi:hypothetical protein